MRTLILEHEFAEPGDLKRMEKEIKKVRVTQGPREVCAGQEKHIACQMACASLTLTGSCLHVLQVR